jgi:hypothetical protein
VASEYSQTDSSQFDFAPFMGTSYEPGLCLVPGHTADKAWPLRSRTSPSLEELGLGYDMMRLVPRGGSLHLGVPKSWS